MLLLCVVFSRGIGLSGELQSAKSFLSAYNVGYLTVAEGLPHNFVDDIYRDSRGFLWIALGGGGLSRYDGNEFINFNITSEDYPLPGNFPVEIAEDRFERLWVATDGGLCALNLYTLGMEEIEDHTGRLFEVLQMPVWAVTVDADGKLWARAVNSIICIEFGSDGSVTAVSELTGLSHPTGMIALRDVYGNGRIWALVNGAIAELEARGNDGVISADTVSECLRFVPDIVVSDMLLYGSEVWLATDRGLCRYNPAEDIAKMYVHDEADTLSISQNFVSTLAVSPDKRLLAGTLQGFNVYNQINDNFERIRQQHPVEPGSINNNFINKIYVDGARIWIGTEGCGINRLSPKRLRVRSITHNFNAPGFSFNTPVNAILAEDDGSLWVGAIEGGLHRGDGSLDQFRHYSTASGHLEHNSVSSLARDGRGDLCVGTWGGGVCVLSEGSGGALRRIKHILDTDDGSGHIRYIGALAWDSINNLMWIGASRGLFIYDPESGAVSEAYKGSMDDIFGAVGSIVCPDGHLWFGTSKGLVDIDLRKYASDPSSGAVRRIRGRLDNPYSVADERITFLYRDNEGTIWIATNGSGVFRRCVDGDNEFFVNYTTADGLPSDIVLGIAGDRDGNIWFSTYRGLGCLTPDGDIVAYDKDGDLSTDQFYWNAAATDTAGKVLFGTTEGLMSIDGEMPLPDSVGDNSVVFTHVWVDNSYLMPGGENDEPFFCPMRGLRLHESNRSVQFEFSAFDYDGNSGGIYSYRLIGFDNEWRSLPEGRRYAAFTNLKPGSYTLQVRYIHKGQNEEEAAVTELPIKVTPYFYRTWWFILLCVAALTAIVVLFYKLRLRSLKRQQRLLQTTVEERTAEIEEQKRQVQQLTMDRISFFTNITHEFRTPITLILGPIERALKLSYNPQVIEQLHFAERNSKYLLTLVNQLMDFRKIESGKMEIMRSRGNLRAFLSNIIEIFRPIAIDRSIDLRLCDRLPRPVMSFDEEALQKVLINLLGNALKFTPDGGRIVLYAALLPSSCTGGAEAVYIAVADTGTGIAAGDLDRIFDRFYQGSSPMKYPVSGTAGSGIGLYLCHSLIDIYGGSISVRNNPGGSGCTFRVVVPLPEGETAEAELPMLPAAARDKSGPNEEVVRDTAVSKKSTVLVVEDNDDMRAFIRSILADRFTVAEARNGEEALRVLANREINLIISDLMMPVMDGMELSRQVKENFDISHIPFLMLTAKTGREPRLESYRMGVDAYITKPFDEELLMARIDGILKSRRGYQKNFAAGLDVDSLNISEESRDKKFMDQVMKVVADNYRNSYFEIGDFAEALGVSRSLLNKKLQSLVGQSAGQLLRAFRLKTAHELIVRNRRTRTMNISEIAYEVGFNDSKYFTRCFTKHFSINPSALMNEDS